MMLRTSLFILPLAGLTLLVAACGAADGLPADPAHAAGATASLSAAGPTLASSISSAAASAPPSATASPSAVGSPSATPTVTPTPWPTYTPTPTPCGEAQGNFISAHVPSGVLRYDIDTRIYLPPCYATSGQAYPVLYLIHGLSFGEEQWERLGAGTTADQLIAAGQIAPLIIVLPRDREDPRFDPAFVVDLVPYVDGHYRTRPTASYRAIGGMSRGGGWSIHLGLHYPNIFGRVGAHSPAVFFGDENKVLQLTRAVAASGSSPALYIDVGADDGEPQSAVWLDQIFTWFKLPHSYVVQPGGHSDSYWSAHLADYLRFYAAGWRPAPPPTRTPIPTATVRFE